MFEERNTITEREKDSVIAMVKAFAKANNITFSSKSGDILRFSEELDFIHKGREFHIVIRWGEVKNVYNACMAIVDSVSKKFNLKGDPVEEAVIFDIQKMLYKSLVNRAYGRVPETVIMGIPPIKNVIFNKPATIVFWADGTKTIVKTQNDESFDPEKGLAMAITKKSLGNEGNYYEHVKKWTKDVEDESYLCEGDDVTPQAEKAYKVLTDLLNKPRTTHIEKTEAIKEALGYLGEVLDGPKED